MITSFEVADTLFPVFSTRDRRCLTDSLNLPPEDPCRSSALIFLMVKDALVSTASRFPLILEPPRLTQVRPAFRVIDRPFSLKSFRGSGCRGGRPSDAPLRKTFF